MHMRTARRYRQTESEQGPAAQRAAAVRDREAFHAAAAAKAAAEAAAGGEEAATGAGAAAAAAPPSAPAAGATRSAAGSHAPRLLEEELGALKAICARASEQLSTEGAAPVWDEALTAMRAAKLRAEAALVRQLASRARGAGGAPGSAAAFAVPDDAVPGGSLKRLKPAIEGGLSRKRPAPPRPELGPQRPQLLGARATRRKGQGAQSKAPAQCGAAAPAGPRQPPAGAPAGHSGGGPRAAAAGSAPAPFMPSALAARAAAGAVAQLPAAQGAGGAAEQPAGQPGECPHGLTVRCFLCDAAAGIFIGRRPTSGS